MSPRPSRLRKVSNPPVISGFKPYRNNSVDEKAESVFLQLEEYEALRLCYYQWKIVRAVVSLQHINHLDTNPLPDRESYETYTLLNAGLSVKLFGKAELFVNAENILNQEYTNNIYYPMPGITFFSGIKLKI